MDDQPLEPRELFDRQGLDIVALIWVGCTIASVGCQIYNVLDVVGGGAQVWQKIAVLGQTGGPIVAVSCLIGIGLAALSDTAAARFAIVLAGVVGAWVLVAGAFEVAAAVHSRDTAIGFGFGHANRALSGISGLALAGLGLVVVMIALRAYDRAATRVSPAPQTLR
jgi:hypothetical protein